MPKHGPLPPRPRARPATAGGRKGAGAVVTQYGSATGPQSGKRLVLTQNSSGVPGAAEAGDRFGDSVRLLDLDKNGRAELSVGAAGENSYGMLTVPRSCASGITTSSPVGMSARTVGPAGDSWFGAVFGR